MELPGPSGYEEGDRYIPIEVSTLDTHSPVYFNYVLEPPVEMISSPQFTYFLYPLVDYGSSENPYFEVITTFWTESDGYSSATSNIPWWDGGYTAYRLNEFSLLFTNIAEGFDLDYTSFYDPLEYIAFDCDGRFLDVDYNVTVARKSEPNSPDAYSYKQLGGSVAYYGGFDGSLTVSDFLVDMFYQDLVFDYGTQDIYQPERGDVITEIEFRIYHDSLADYDETEPEMPYVPFDIYFTPFTQRCSSINVAQVTTLLGNPDVELVVGSGYEKGYVDGRNSALTERLGVVDWLVDAGDAVMNFQLFSVAGTPITIGSIFTVILGSLLIIFILKVFAGG